MKEDDDSDMPSSSASDKLTKGRILFLQKQLRISRESVAEKKKEIEKISKNYEQRINTLEMQLIERTGLVDISDANEAVKNNPPLAFEKDLCAEISSKDCELLDLSNKLIQCEQHVQDLQENIKEKDEVLKSRDEAFKLMCASNSDKMKFLVDDLEETRNQMCIMQTNFTELEMELKQKRLNLESEVCKLEKENMEKNSTIHSLAENLEKNESIKHKLIIDNGNLQKKLVLSEENTRKQFAIYESKKKTELDNLTKLLEDEKTCSKDAQNALHEIKNQVETEIHDVRVKERMKLKDCKRELQKLQMAYNEVTEKNMHSTQIIDECNKIKFNFENEIRVMKMDAEKFKLSNDSFMKEIETLHDQKVKLEMRVTELEEIRDSSEKQSKELHEKLSDLMQGNTLSSVQQTPLKQIETYMKDVEELKTENAELKGEKQYLLQSTEELRQNFLKLNDSIVSHENELNGSNQEVATLKGKIRVLEKDMTTIFSTIKVKSIEEFFQKWKYQIQQLEAAKFDPKEEKTVQCDIQEEQITSQIDEQVKLQTSICSNKMQCEQHIKDLSINLQMKEEQLRTTNKIVERLNDENKKLLKGTEELKQEVLKLNNSILSCENKLNGSNQEVAALKGKLEVLEKDITIIFSTVEVQSIEEFFQKWKYQVQQLEATKLDPKEEKVVQCNIQEEEITELIDEQVRLQTSIRSNKMQYEQHIKDLSVNFQMKEEELRATNEIVERLTDENKNLLKDAEELRQNVSNLGNIIVSCENKLTGSNEEVATLKGKLEVLEKDITIIFSTVEVQSIEEFFQKWKYQVQQLEATKLDPKEEKVVQCNIQEEEITELIDEQVRLQTSIRSNKMQYEQHIKDLSVNFQMKEEELRATNEIVERLTDENKNLLKDAEELRQNVSNLGNIIVSCENKLTGSNEEVATLKGKLEVLEKDITTIFSTAEVQSIEEFFQKWKYQVQQLEATKVDPKEEKMVHCDTQEQQITELIDEQLKLQTIIYNNKMQYEQHINDLFMNLQMKEDELKYATELLQEKEKLLTELNEQDLQLHYLEEKKKADGAHWSPMVTTKSVQGQSYDFKPSLSQKLPPSQPLSTKNVLSDQRLLIDENMPEMQATGSHGILNENGYSDQTDENEHRLLIHDEDSNVLAEGEFSIIRQISVNGQRFQRWFRGQRNLFMLCRRGKYLGLLLMIYVCLIHIWLVTCLSRC